MRNLVCWLVMLCSAVALSACGRVQDATAPMNAVRVPREMSAGADKAVLRPERLLSYSHVLTLRLAEGQLQAAYQSVLTACHAVPDDGCWVMNAHISTETASAANVKLMVRRDAVNQLLAQTKGLGQVQGQGTTAEDITGPITDTGRRLAMKKSLRDELLALREQSRGNVDALLKVTEKLTEVQAEIEADEGDLAHLNRRVAMDEVEIFLGGPNQGEGPGPIRSAFRDFGEDVARGAGAAISCVALALPWLLVLVVLPFVWRGLRRVWRMGRR